MEKTSMDARIVIHHGMFSLEALTETAEYWTKEHLPEGSSEFGGCFHLKARHMPAVLEAMKNDGLKVHVTM